MASGGRIPGADPLLATPWSASSVHSDAEEHPGVTETVGGFWTASCACHAPAGSCHGAAVVCALRVQAAAV